MKLVLILLSVQCLIVVGAFRTNCMQCVFHSTNSQQNRHASKSYHRLNAASANEVKDESIGTISSSPTPLPSPQGTTNSSQKQYRIQQAKYSHMTQVAEIMTHAFHPELDDNPIFRKLRVLLEMDRLQSNFPYDDPNHSYLVIVSSSQQHGGEEIVGFCDIDYRSPTNYDTNPFSMLDPSSSNHVIRHRPYLSDLAIHPSHRRRGLASLLMSQVEEMTKNRGGKELYLGVAEENAGALKMYDGRGYGVLDHFNGSGINGVRLLRLEL